MTVYMTLTALGCGAKDGRTPGAGSEAVESPHSDCIARVLAQATQRGLGGCPTTDNDRLERAVHHADVVNVLLFFRAVHGVANQLAVPRLPWRYLQWVIYVRILFIYI